jgi:predicted Zn finger-like uncharacterized protein
MPLTGPAPEGGTFFCPHCGALYSVTHSRLPKRDSNIAKCVVCKQTMDERDKVPLYKLIHRPETSMSRKVDGLAIDRVAIAQIGTFACWRFP